MIARHSSLRSTAVTAVLCIVLLACAQASVPSASPNAGSKKGSPTTAHPAADPKIMPAAQKLLDYLYVLKARTGTDTPRVISGQYHLAECSTIARETGHFPGLMGEWFAKGIKWNEFGPVGEGTDKELFEYWKAGGIVTVHLLPPNPKNRSDRRDYDFTEADMVAAVTPGTATNANLNEWLDCWAAHAQWLQERGVPIIVRPYMEMNEVFWYRDMPAKAYGDLWRYTFRHLTVTRGLHNLLFAFAPAAYNGSKGNDGEYTLYYPGDAYVDILGLDLYIDLTGTNELTAHDCRGAKAISGLADKPFALCEFGPNTGKSTGRCDYRKLMAGIKAYMPYTVYWQSWSEKWGMTSAFNDHCGEVIADPWVITRDEIPNLKGD